MPRNAPATLRAMVTSAAILILAATACGGTGQDGTSKTVTSTPVASDLTDVPGAAERVTLRGALTLDGAPLEAEFLGVRVIRNGLPAACQYTIPAVTQGRYEVRVVADAEVSGCGTPGAELLLWAFAKDAFIFSEQTVPWPGSGGTATFDASFSSDAREGAGKPVTEFKGHLFDREGARLPGGTVLEALVGDVRCGVTSLRYGDDFEGYYTLVVAGPEFIPACAEGARLTFRLNGEPAAETAFNDLGRGNEGHELNLAVE